uniref:NADH-ubiquinone oxidoreductase chain 6 n=1 Tax=Coeliccia cyanomelas TaxID=476659 RepID=A0A6C0R1Y8_9ODON|nr:NADH dehydrogenase subunit 6 [Coeliccia cyanomelas]
MSQLMFLLLSVPNSLSFIFMKHPMSMGIMLMMQTIFVCMKTNNMAQSPWFSYILFLVFLGGMLVLFIYMTSVASNELFVKNKFSLMIIIIMSMTMMILMLMDPILMFNNSYDANMFIQNKNELNNNLFNFPTNIMTLIMVMYLFLTLVVVVNITDTHQGPLRSN